MKSILIILTSLFFFNLAQAMNKNCDDMTQFKDVSKTEMQEIVKNSSAAIIDVNSKSSYKKSHIPKAIHFATHKSDLAKVLPKDKNQMVIAYCGGKMCTAWERAAKAACEMGYTNIRHFSEGITGWNKKG